VAEGRGEVTKRLSNISFAKQEGIPYYKDSAGSHVVPPLIEKHKPISPFELIL
jgi:hypothetical protein